MDTIVSTRGCPGISYLITCTRAMLPLNIGLSSLALSLGVGKDNWITIEVLSGAISMETVRDEISEYDLELTNSIGDL